MVIKKLGGHPADWQARAKAAKLSQRQIARLLGHTDNTVSRQLRGLWDSGTPQHVIAAILAWEIMSPEQRADWQGAVERELKRREKKG